MSMRSGPRCATPAPTSVNSPPGSAPACSTCSIRPATGSSSGRARSPTGDRQSVAAAVHAEVGHSVGAGHDAATRATFDLDDDAGSERDRTPVARQLALTTPHHEEHIDVVVD